MYMLIKKHAIIIGLLIVSIVMISCEKEYLVLEENNIESVELLYPDDSEKYVISKERAEGFVSILNDQKAVEVDQEPVPAGGGAHGVIEYDDGYEVFFNVAGKLFITRETNGEFETKTYKVDDYKNLNDKLCDFAKIDGVLVSDKD